MINALLLVRRMAQLPAEDHRDDHDPASTEQFRKPWRDYCEIEGDATAAARFLDVLNIV